MKKILLAIASLSVIFSCAKEEQQGPAQNPSDNSEPFRIEVGVGPDSKTVFNPEDASVAWADDDMLSVHVTDGTTAGTGIYKFTRDTKNPNTFKTTEFTPEEGKTYTYSMLYPYDSNHKIDNIGADGYTTGYSYVALPTSKSSSLTQPAFGDGSKVKGALYAQATAVGTATPKATMSHLTHILCAKITNSTGADLNVTEVSITNDAGQNMSGTYFINFSTGAIRPSGANYVSESVSVGVTNGTLAAGATGTVYVVTPEFTIPAGKKLIFTVTCAEGEATIEKPMTSELVCAAGGIRNANLVLNSENYVAKPTMTPLSGKYVIVAKSGSDYYAMSNVTNGDRLSVKKLDEFSETASYVTDNTIIWTFAQEGSKYTFKSSDNKCLRQHGTSGKVYFEELETATTFDITWDYESNTYMIISEESDAEGKTWRLGYNNSYTWFAIYSSTQMIDDLYIVPVVEDTREQLATPQNVEAKVVDGTPNSIIVSWDAVTNATKYVVTCGEESKEVSELTATFEDLSYSTDYSISVIAKSDSYKSSEAGTTTVTTDASLVQKTVCTKVTSLSDISVGDRVIIVATEKSVALSETQNTGSKVTNNNRAQVSVTVSGNDVSYDSSISKVEILTIKAGFEDGSFAFATNNIDADDKNDGYLSLSSDGNGLYTSTELNKQSSWVIAINESNITTITNKNFTNRSIKYNSSSPRFACYTSGQTDVAIYKLSN